MDRAPEAARDLRGQVPGWVDDRDDLEAWLRQEHPRRGSTGFNATAREQVADELEGMVDLGPDEEERRPPGGGGGGTGIGGGGRGGGGGSGGGGTQVIDRTPTGYRKIRTSDGRVAYMGPDGQFVSARAYHISKSRTS